MIWAFLAGAALDAALGEPRWLWSRVAHPAVLMGRLIGWADGRFNRGAGRRVRGAVLVLALVLGAGALGLGLVALPGRVAEALVLAVLLAQRSLVDHVRAVATGLGENLAAGRAAVALIVGRDTGAMDEAAVARGAIESAAENLGDGVIAPGFWFLIGGLPGLLIYKIVNTADSMIGYRTPRHEAFGWAAARLDDVLNFIPARLTALLISPWAFSDFAGLRRDAALHRSPNAGWPEAAMARVLGVQLSGPRSYEGEMRDFPYVNAAGRVAEAGDISRAVRRLWLAWARGLAAVSLCAVFPAVM